MSKIITTIVIDLDGCLTDGKQRIDQNGQKVFKTFHARDRQTIRRLLSSGYRVIVATADDWPGAKHWVESIVGENGAQAEFIHTRKKHELPVDWQFAFGVSDDYEDVHFLEKCAMAVAPMDADPRIQVRRLKVNGGCGIAEWVERELQNLTHNNFSQPQKPESNAVPIGAKH